MGKTSPRGSFMSEEEISKAIQELPKMDSTPYIINNPSPLSEYLIQDSDLEWNIKT
jgi:hypothetical protein